MKKIYVFVVLVTHIFYSSNMAMHREPIPRILQPLFPTKPFGDTTETSSSSSPYTTQQPNQIQSTTITTIPCQQNQPTLFAPFTTNPIDLLTTRYINSAQTKKTIETQEPYSAPFSHKASDVKKPLLNTNSLKPDTELMNKLYCDMLDFIEEEKSNTYLQHKNQVSKLTLLINSINGNNLSARSVGQWLYDNKKEYEVDNMQLASDVLIIPKEDIGLLPAFLCVLLEKYTATVHETNEQLPYNPDTQKPSFKDALGLTSNITEPLITYDLTDTYVNPKKYPAFLSTLLSLRYALQELTLEAINKFTTYIYADQNIVSKDFTRSFYGNIKDDFYNKAYNFLFKKGSINDLYNLLQMIDNAKKNGDITSDTAFEADILELVQDWFHSETRKNYFIIFFRLIEKYRQTRRKKDDDNIQLTRTTSTTTSPLRKTTPTPTQYQVWSLIKQLDITLPTSYDTAFLNENRYALEEFKNLFEYSNRLKTAYTNGYHNKIQEHVNELNAQKQSTILSTANK